jgi:hypothetical protein
MVHFQTFYLGWLWSANGYPCVCELATRSWISVDVIVPHFTPRPFNHVWVSVLGSRKGNCGDEIAGLQL